MVNTVGIVLFFISYALLNLLLVFKPEIIVNLEIKWFRWVMKSYGFEVDIKPTPTAKRIYRRANTVMFCLFLLLLIILLVTLR